MNRQKQKIHRGPMAGCKSCMDRIREVDAGFAQRFSKEASLSGKLAQPKKFIREPQGDSKHVLGK